MRQNNIKKPLLTMIIFLIMIVANAMANIIPINNITTGAVSDSYPNLFAPAVITFSIWGVIYLLLFIFCLNYLLNHQKFSQEKLELYSRVTTIFNISSVINAIWIVSWHYDQILISWLLMIGILISLIFINLEFKRTVGAVTEDFLAKIAFRVYFGWITIATIANTTTLLVSLGWDRFGLSEEFLTTIILIIGAVIALSAIRKYESVSYGLVVLWAYGGILYKHLTVFNGEYNMIVIVCAVLIIALVVAIFMMNAEKRRLNGYE